MPHIDFRKVFENADAKPSTTAPSQQTIPSSFQPDEALVQPSISRRARLGQAEWTNIIFTIIAIAGGLFVAFYFFNGAELVRVAGSWPREYLYPPPPKESPDSPPLAESLFFPDAGTGAPASSSGNPFSRVTGPLGLASPSLARMTRGPGTSIAGGGTGIPSIPNVPGMPIVPGIPGLPPNGINAGTLISGLGLLPRGADALTQSIHRAMANRQDSARPQVQRTIVVVQRKVTKWERRRIVRNTRYIAGHARGTAGRVANHGRSGVAQAGPATPNVAASAAQQAASSVHGTESGVTRSSANVVSRAGAMRTIRGGGLGPGSGGGLSIGGSGGHGGGGHGGGGHGGGGHGR
jgi:hypothetical protein